MAEGELQLEEKICQQMRTIREIAYLADDAQIENGTLTTQLQTAAVTIATQDRQLDEAQERAAELESTIKDRDAQIRDQAESLFKLTSLIQAGAETIDWAESYEVIAGFERLRAIITENIQTADSLPDEKAHHVAFDTALGRINLAWNHMLTILEGLDQESELYRHLSDIRASLEDDVKRLKADF